MSSTWMVETKMKPNPDAAYIKCEHDAFESNINEHGHKIQAVYLMASETILQE